MTRQIIIEPNNGSYFLFSGGEVHVTLKDEGHSFSYAQIICKDYSMNGLMAVCETAQVLSKQGIICDVCFPYFPYSRQDRWIGEGEPFSLKIFCDILNAQKNIVQVTTVDPHSDVLGALIENLRIIPQHKVFEKVVPAHVRGSAMFVSPDAGAFKKVSKLIPDSSRIIIGTKMRDSSGNILGTSVLIPEGKPSGSHTAFIVDDICDGGRTFIELAKCLKHAGFSKILLYVTHGIFSQGAGVLYDAGIDHIYTTDSFNCVEHSNEKLTVLGVEYYDE